MVQVILFFSAAVVYLLNLGRQLADSNLLRAALRELPASSPARSLVVAEIQGLEA